MKNIDKINAVYRKINAKALYLTTKSNTLYKKIKKFRYNRYIHNINKTSNTSKTSNVSKTNKTNRNIIKFMRDQRMRKKLALNRQSNKNILRQVRSKNSSNKNCSKG